MAFNKIHRFLEEDREYFNSGKEGITKQNYHMMLNGSIMYAAVLIFYTIMTAVSGKSSALAIMYYVFDVIHAALCVGIFRHSKRFANDYGRTQFLCILLELSVLGFFVLEAVYISKTQHSLYVPIAILLVLLLFIHKALYTGVITLLYSSSFAVLSYLYKEPEAYKNDIYIAIATLIASNIGYVLIAQMRHNESAALRKYEELSRTDQLTGLLNKAAIDSACERYISSSDSKCALVLFDLDNFKSINDEYGHDVGDEVLRSVGHTLRDCFREADLLGRFGGDEFIVLMNDCNDLQTVRERLDMLVGRISALRFSKENLRVNCSAGFTMKKDSDTFQASFKRADMALYEAKANGKGNYRAFIE